MANPADKAELCEDNCVICGSVVSPSTSDLRLTTVIQSRGRKAIVDASIRRGDSHLTQYMCCNPGIVKVHESCRVLYNSDRHCELHKRKSDGIERDHSESQSKVLRSWSEVFNWKRDCFLCTKPAAIDSKNPKQKCDKIRFAETKSLFTTIERACEKRKDDWSFEVLGRLKTCGDAIAAEARYHTKCHTYFSIGKPKSSVEQDYARKADRGRRPNKDMLQILQTVCQSMEANLGELYTVVEVQEDMRKLADKPSDVYSVKHLKELLKLRYGEDIWFASVCGRKDVICFRSIASRIISDKWYSERDADIEKESERIVEAAAKLLRGSIREAQFDHENYPLNTTIRDRTLAKLWIPPLLQTFLQTLITDELKQIGIGHSIVQACRPRSVISPVLFGIGVSVDHVLGAEWLIKVLASLGYSLSIDEVTKYKQSVIQTGGNDLPPCGPGIFTQWSADNVDHDVVTLDGTNTFHGMGIISMSVLDRSADVDSGDLGPLYDQSIEVGLDISNHGAFSEVPIKRLRRVNVGNLVLGRGIPILHHTPPNIPVFSQIVFKPFVELQHPHPLQMSTDLDLVWQSGWFFHEESKLRPNWGGFMQNLSIGDYQPAADIRLLPIVDLNPGDKSCILSTLSFVVDQASKLNIVTPCITFDQPLFIKAVEVIECHKLNMVCRLGGFHTIMSYLGSIGSVMAGSGIAEVLESCYGPNTVGHMLAGKAYNRAVRGHLLLDSALHVMLMHGLINCESDECSSLSQADVDALRQLYDGVVEGTCNLQELQPPQCLMQLGSSLEELKNALSAKSRTAKLWLQYMKYIQTLKAFLRAERTSDWKLHLVSLTEMLRLFAATGHSNYAKSGRLYLQMMLDLPEKHPWLHQKFNEGGYHSVRRSDRFWAGLSTDLAIEQVMMKAVKSRGGLTHGRGMTESVRLVWVHSMHKCGTIYASLKSLTGVDEFSNESKHAELGQSRLQRDLHDLNKMLEWLKGSNPFNTSDSRLRSISSGLIASDSDKINCELADEVGEDIMCRMDGIAYTDVVMKKAYQVRTLKELTKTVSVGGNKVAIDSNLLFSRLLIVLERKQEMEPYFEFELTPVPASLFKNESLRKTVKSALAKELTKSLDNKQEVEVPKLFVLDGGCLLHRVVWLRGGTYSQIMQQYVSYVHKHYGAQCMIVFDGYDNGPSVKDHEHERRASNSCPDVDVAEQKTAYKNQTMFLTNSRNKKLFVQILMQKLAEANYSVSQAADDADTLIVKTALDFASDKRPVTVISDDTDVLVMLVHHMTQDMADIYMMSEITRVRTARTAVTPVRVVQRNIGVSNAEQLLLIHAISGCDTTSAMYGLGKSTVFRQFDRHPETLELSRVLCSPTANCEQVAEAGCKLLVVLYGGKDGEALNHLRYIKYMQLLAKSSSRPHPERLPPTERAAYFHLLRVHLQVVWWKTLQTSILNPTEWGWKVHDSVYVPIMTDLKAAPDDVLNVIACKCKTSTSSPCASKLCTCRSYGLHCVPACKNCYGELCSNASMQTVADLMADSDDDCEEVHLVASPQVCDSEIDLEASLDLNEQEYVFPDDMYYEEEIVEATTYMDG